MSIYEDWPAHHGSLVLAIGTFSVAFSPQHGCTFVGGVRVCLMTKGKSVARAYAVPARVLETSCA